MAPAARSRGRTGGRSRIHRRPLVPPVASSSRSQATVSPVVRSTSKPGRAARTPHWVRTVTPFAAAEPRRQSTIVAELSVAGNMRPSGSVFRATPWAANHATVSARAPAVKRSAQFPPAPRIALHQFVRLKTGVRDVAAAAPGNPHLGQRVRGGLADHDAGRRVPLRGGERREISRRAAAGDHDPVLLHAGRPTCARDPRLSKIKPPRAGRRRGGL